MSLQTIGLHVNQNCGLSLVWLYYRETRNLFALDRLENKWIGKINIPSTLCSGEHFKIYIIPWPWDASFHYYATSYKISEQLQTKATAKWCLTCSISIIYQNSSKPLPRCCFSHRLFVCSLIKLNSAASVAWLSFEILHYSPLYILETPCLSQAAY